MSDSEDAVQPQTETQDDVFDLNDLPFAPDEGIEDVQQAEAEPEKAADEPEGSTPEPDKQPEKPQWDKERQRRDQERAEEFKALKESNAELREQLSELVAAMKSVGKKEQEPQPDPIDLLTEEADAPEIVTGLKAVRSENKELREIIKQLQDQLAEVAQKDQRREVESSKSRGNAMMNEFVAKLDKEFGAQYRNEAIKKAMEDIAELGYGDENPAPFSVARIALKGGYRFAAAQKPKAAKTDEVSLDPATGGGKAIAAEEGSVDKLWPKIKKKYGLK
jgi:myosin heavy subunit